MIENQKTETVQVSEIPARAAAMSGEGYRLVQISCIRKPDHFEINYTFDKDYVFMNYRIDVPADKPVVPSITPVYWCAFPYENEIHDLFGVDVQGNALDFQGTFYRTQVSVPFAAMPNVNVVSVKKEG